MNLKLHKETIKAAIREGYKSEINKHQSLQVWLKKNKVSEKVQSPSFKTFAVKALSEFDKLNEKKLNQSEYTNEVIKLADKIKQGRVNV